MGQADQQIRGQVGILTESPGLYERLSAWDNLAIFAELYGVKDVQGQVEKYLRLLELWDRRADEANTLSKGMKQKLAIARALMAKPRVLLLDEPSMGLAPIITGQIYEQIRHLNQAEGLSILLVEQNAKMALNIAVRGYVIETGRIVMEGISSELKARNEIQRAYLGKDVDAENK